MDLVKVADLRVGYGGTAILPALSFSLKRREFWALVGRNGSGKTTLLRTMLGLLKRVSGEVHWGKGVRIGYVPQRESIDLSVPGRVIDYVRAGLDRGWGFTIPFLSFQRVEAVEKAMEDTKISHLARRQYRTLSEGQKQRVLMARVLAGEPQLLILDEPTSAMDVVAEHEVFELLESFRRERSLGVIVVSHHLPVVAGHATHVIMAAGNEGLAFAGSVKEAMKNEAFVKRYGQVFDGACVECGAHSPEEVPTSDHEEPLDG